MQDLQVLQLDMKDFMPQLTMQYNTHTSLYSRNSHCSSPFWSGCKKRSGRSLLGFPSDQQSAIGMPRSTIFIESMPQNMDGNILKSAIVNAARILSTQVRNSKQWSQSRTAYYLNQLETCLIIVRRWLNKWTYYIASERAFRCILRFFYSLYRNHDFTEYVEIIRVNHQ